MKISVWDTYVQREDGRRMYFDILVPCELKDERMIFDFGKDYLKSKSIEKRDLTTNECRFCHVERASEEMVEKIREQAYTIIEMENCD